MVLLSKRDLLPPAAALPVLDAPGSIGAVAFSSVAGTGLEDLKEYLWKAVGIQRKEAADAETAARELEEWG